MKAPSSRQPPLVSVITVVRNGARFLGQALDSIFQQSYRPIQAIVVDGQSTDGSDRIAQSYAEIDYVRQGTLGLSAARNLGIERARGELIALLDHDDYWPATKLELQVEHMLAHPHLLLTTTRFTWFMDASTQAARVKSVAHLLGSPQAGPTPGTLLARRAAFRLNGLFDTSLTVAGDSEWFVRARDLRLAVEQLPAVLLYKRFHDANLSAQSAVYRTEWLRVLRASAANKAHTASLQTRSEP
jgi:glycosyltransferase involved in cell wall biosynthesis